MYDDLYHVFTNVLFFQLQVDLFDQQINCTEVYYISFSILGGYRIVLCIIGCVLAFQNRKVKILELRESQQVGLATYAFLFMVILEAALIIAVQNKIVLAILLSVDRQCATTFFLLILFVPKVKLRIIAP